MIAQREPWHTRVQAVPEPWCPSLTSSEAVLGMASGCPIAHMRGVWCWKPSFSLSSTLWVGGKEIHSNVGRKEILMGEGCWSLGEATLTTSSCLAHSPPAHWLSPEGRARTIAFDLSSLQIFVFAVNTFQCSFLCDPRFHLRYLSYFKH